MSISSKTLHEGQVVGDRYKIQEFLGAGGIADVYACEDFSEHKGRMAIKVLHRTSYPGEGISACSRQFSYLCRLRHPRLARMIDFGVLDGTGSLFFIQELVSGRDISSGTQGMETKEVLSLILQLSRVLKYLHAQGIVHGNLRPSNAVLSAGEKGQPSIQLMDFGLSDCIQTIKTNASEAPAYTAPETLMGRANDARSDMYSLGVVIYQLLTRRLPFEDADPGFLVQKHLQGSVDFRSVERLERGATLAGLLQRLLDKNPEQRPGCGEALEIISEALGAGVDSGSIESEKYFSVAQFVGRTKEMSLLTSCARRVRETGRGWTVFLTGEAGAGKTRCMEEFRIWALLEGWRVIEGSCGIREEGSYEPYRQILSKTESGSGNAIFQFGSSSRIETSSSFDSFSEFAAGQFRDLLTRELVRRLCAKPTILLLHDFHGADEATSTVLDYLSSDIQAHPVLMCVSSRSGEEIKGSLARVMELVLRQQRGEVLELEPLSKDQVEELVIQMTGAGNLKNTLGTWMHRSVGGNPFFLEEMLKHLLEQGLLKRESGQWRFFAEGLRNLEVPEGVSGVLQRRLEKLLPHARGLAAWMALMNRPVSRKFLGLLMAQDNSEISEALQELSQRQLVLVETNNAEDVVEFRHALISEVIRAGISQKRRQKMHQSVADLLEMECEKEGHLQELATHYSKAGPSEKGAKYALEAAELCRKEYADEAALQFYEYVFSCRRFVPQNRIHEILIDAAESHCTLGNPARAISIIRKEFRRNSSCIQLKTKVGLLLELASSYRDLGDLDKQELHAKKALSFLRNHTGYGERNLKATILTHLAYSCLLKARPSQGLRLAEKALTIIPDVKENAVAGRLYSVISGLRRISCSLQSAVIAAVKSIEILEPLCQFPRLSVAYSHTGACLFALGRLRAALEHHQRAVQISEHIRSIPLRAQALGNIGECLCRQGEIEDAAAASETAVKLSVECGNRIMTYSCLATLAEIKITCGDYLAAEQILNQLSGERNSFGPVFSKAQVAYLRALLSFELGDFESTLQQVAYLLGFENREAPAYEHELGEALKFRVLYEHGRKPEAIRSLIILDGILKRKHWPYNLCIVKLHLSECLVAEKESERAAKVLRNAIRLAKGMGSDPLLAKARLLMGRALFQMADGNMDFLLNYAKPEVMAATEISEKCGIPEIIWRAHAELARIEEILSDWDSCGFHNSRSIEQLTNLEAKVPKPKLQKFLAAFERGNTLLECEQRKSSIGSRSRFSNLRFEEIQEQQIRTLLKVSSIINSIRDMDSLLESISVQLIEAFDIERAFVFLKEANTANLGMAKGRNRKGETFDGFQDVDMELLNQVGKNGKPFLTANAEKDPRLGSINESGAPPAGTILCAPLKISGRILGVLYADRSTGSDSLEESTINMFATFCNLAAMAIDNALAHRQLINEKTELEQYLHQAREGYTEIVGKSRAIEALRDRIGLAAASPLDILITGESGTGKELVARAIHRTGRRKSGRFIPIDCGSLTDSLAEAELFGYRKGAFTGAAENRQGLLEAAQGGIIFLDEISNLPYRLQAKLLRVLQEREVRRIGENIPRKIDMQIVAATNRDLQEETKNGRFRRDLYYRLKAMEIRVPLLREHLEDVPLLIEWFLEKIAEMEGGRFKKFSSESLELLKRYSYPGNIRELKNIVDSSYYSTVGSIISPDELPPEICVEQVEPIEFEASVAGGIYRDILEGKGDFETLVKEPFLQHQFGSPVVRSIIQKVLSDTSGRYKESFARLRIPERRYSVTIQFLKRNRCYLDFRPFRRKELRTAKA